MHAELKRALFPLTARHRASALVTLACATACWPLAVVCAAIDGYREAQRAVLTPEGACHGT